MNLPITTTFTHYQQSRLIDKYQGRKKDYMGRGIRPRPKHIGKKFRLIREHLGLTQAEVCKRLRFKTVLPHSISEYESGKREPPYPVTLKIARMAGISTDILIDDRLKLSKLALK